MKNLFLAIAIVFSLFNFSCEPEYFSLSGDANDLDSANGDYVSSFVNPYDIIAEEKAALQRKWGKGSHLYFNAPIKHEDNIIYHDRDLMSINTRTGMTNWALNLGYIPNFENAVKYKDAIYLTTGGNIMFGVDINTGEIIFEYKWPGHENLHDEILIDDGVMFVSVNDCDYKYSSFAYCPLESLRSGEWIYFNRKDAIANESEYTSIRKKVIFTNENKHKIIIAMTSVGSIYAPTTKVELLEAFNVNNNEIEWASEDYNGKGFLGQMLLYKDQFILRGRDHLMGINQKTGFQIWEKNVNEYASSLSQGSTFFIHENKLYLFNLKHVFATYSNDTSRKEVARAYDLNKDMALIWKSYAGADSFQDEQGISKYTFNIVEDKIYYISDVGYLMDMDISTGELSRYHEELKFDSGLFVTLEKEIIAIPEFDDTLLSFSIE